MWEKINKTSQSKKHPASLLSHCTSAYCPNKKKQPENTVIKYVKFKKEKDSGNAYEIPVTIADHKCLAFVDTGASHTCISENLVNELKLEIIPTKGVIQTASNNISIPRIGKVCNIEMQCGKFKDKVELEIIKDLVGPPILIGRELITKLGFNVFGLPFMHEEAAPPAESIIEPINQIATTMNSNEFPELEKSRKIILKILKNKIDINQNINPHEPCPIEQAEIYLPTPPNAVTYRRQYLLPLAVRDIVTKIVKEWLDEGVIEPAPVDSTFNTPIFIIPKKDANGIKSDFRPCLDYRPLNALIPDDNFPLPRIAEIFEALAGAQYFTTLDLKSAYHRFPIHKDDRHKTAFTWKNIQYVFARAPFGLKTLPAKFQRVIATLFKDLDYALPYLDDIVVFSKNLDKHKDHLAVVLDRLNKAKLILNIPKCHFVCVEVKLLGFIISKYGHAIDPNQIANVSDWMPPKSAKELQHYLGFFNYFREHIPMVSKLTASLDKLRNSKNIIKEWDNVCEETFVKLKTILFEAPILNFVKENKKLYVATDASLVGIGAVLYQLKDESKVNADSNRNFISFQSRSLSKSERNYSATRRELLAIVFALRKFHHFVWGRHFTLFTDHAALVYLHTQSTLNPMLISWCEIIFDYNFTVIHIPGINNILPDHLSRFFSDLEGSESVSDIIVRKMTLTDCNYIIPETEKRMEILERIHLKGHFGESAMIAAVQDKGYNWPGLKKDVRKVCQTCITCLKFNNHNERYHELNTITSNYPFEHIAIDLAGPFPTSFIGNNFLFVLIDIHSRFVLLKPIKNKTMEIIAETLIELFTIFGFPKILQSDNGTEFVNQLVDQISRSTMIEHRLISPYHPRANGAAERSIQTAKRILVKMIKGIRRSWDKYIPFIQYCMNTKISTRHKMMPFQVMFGRRPNELKDYKSNDILPDDLSNEQLKEIEKQVNFMHTELFPKITRQSIITSDKYKRYFNRKNKLIEIPIETHVMLKDKLIRDTFDAKYQGPFKVVGKNRGGAYTLQDLDGQILPRKFPPSQLVPIPDLPIFKDMSYEIEKIINHRDTSNGREYLIKWKNYPDEDNSWEPESNLDDFEIVHRYQKQIESSLTPSSEGSDVVNHIVNHRK